MKRKSLVAMLLISALVIAMTACGKADDESGKGKSEQTSKKVEIPEFDTSATIQETVLVDENNVKITATELKYTSYEVELNVTVANNSDKNLSFITGAAGYACNAINGYMIDDGYMSVDVAPGKIANETIGFAIEELQLYGINSVADIQIGFMIGDDDYNKIYTKPIQLKTSIADSYDYEADTFAESVESGVLESLYECTVDYRAEDELYNQKYVGIVSQTVLTNKEGEKSLLLEIENNSTELLYGVVSNVSLNNLVVCSSTWKSDLMIPGTKRIMNLSLNAMIDAEYWDSFGFSEVEEVGLSFAVKDLKFSDVAVAEPIVVTVSKKQTKLNVSGKELYSENGIRIISKGLLEDDDDYTNVKHLILLIENNSADIVRADYKYDSLSVNGVMADCFVAGTKVAPEQYTLLDLEIDTEDLEEEIKEIGVTIELKTEKYKEIASPSLTVEF